MNIKGKDYVIEMEGQIFHCALDVTMNYIGGKWKTVVLWYLRNGTKRFSELKKHIPEITEKMLSIQLKQLERDGIIHRKVYPEVPPKVEYCLSEEGKSLIPMLEEMAKWGRQKGELSGKMILINKPDPSKNSLVSQ